MKVTFTEEQINFVIHSLNIVKSIYAEDYKKCLKRNLPKIAAQFLCQAAETDAIIKYLQSH